MNRTAVDTHENWLDPEDLEFARRRLPILYVNAVPTRVDDTGVVTAFGLLLRSTPEGEIHRELVAGRVMHHERVRDALKRHIEKDLGPHALPQIPASPLPFTVAEYFPTPGASAYHDPRQHAVALAFVIPVTGDCTPRQDALDLVWLPPSDAADDAVQKEMLGGHGLLLRQALAHLGYPPAG
ncbi:NUDIX hydrolase family protein [Haloactinopolyspora alba]|uniref:NUDIX hydrolase family protein n=1 Tax=Haloactinopolyspora alba TaxID=648780 RepID=UPI000D0D8017|nr:NUDIX hydrolase family protein [Haloactinopolyspora alba]